MANTQYNIEEVLGFWDPDIILDSLMCNNARDMRNYTDITFLKLKRKVVNASL